MKILHLSDTHGCHRRLGDLPEADVVVHSGDFCMVGSQREAIDFLDWLCDLPHRHKIFICGNHDECLYEATISGLGPGVHYLCNSGIEIDGISFYGVPMFLHDSLSGRQAKHLSALPSGTDVVITHTPPHGILDFADGITMKLPEAYRNMKTTQIAEEVKRRIDEAIAAHPSKNAKRPAKRS